MEQMTMPPTNEQIDAIEAVDQQTFDAAITNLALCAALLKTFDEAFGLSASVSTIASIADHLRASREFGQPIIDAPDALRPEEEHAGLEAVANMILALLLSAQFAASLAAVDDGPISAVRQQVRVELAKRGFMRRGSL